MASSSNRNSTSTDGFINPRNPFFIHANENPSQILVQPALDDNNYHSWSRSMRIALKSKNKIGFINNRVGILKEGDENFDAWDQANCMVVSWMMNSISKPVAQSLMWINTAQEIWTELAVRYSQGDAHRLSDILEEINSMKQGDKGITEHFTNLKSLWEELLAIRPLQVCECRPQCTCTVPRRIKEQFEEDCVIRFLKSLSDKFTPVKDKVFLLQPLPTMNQVLSMAITHERQSLYAAAHNTESNAAAFMAMKDRNYIQRNNNSYGRGEQEFRYNAQGEIRTIKCYHCGIIGHVESKCYKKNGYPNAIGNRGRGRYGGGRGTSAMVNQAEFMNMNDSEEDLNAQREWEMYEASQQIGNTSYTQQSPAGFNEEQLNQIMGMIKGAFELHNKGIEEPKVNQAAVLNANFDQEDQSGKDHRRNRVANAYFSLWMAVGNVLGYATGAYSGWYKIFPFTLTPACNINCANLKSAFIIDIIFIVIATIISVTAAKEQPLVSSNNSAPFGEEISGQSSQEQEPLLWELFGTFKYFTGVIWVIFLAIALTWIGWFPFTLYDTDWMGREIYGGEPNDGQKYSAGVRMGAFGLMFNSIVLGITSVFMEKLCGKWGAAFTWGVSNIIMSLCFIGMLLIEAIRANMDIGNHPPPDGIVIAALVVFSILGIPLAVTNSVPYALISSRIEALGLGQGLSMGVLNLAIVLPQIVVSLGSGPWDELFGGGNSPALAVAAVSAFISGLIAILAIPRTRVEKPRTRQ